MKIKNVFFAFLFLISIKAYGNDLQASQLEERILQDRKLDFSFQDERFQFGITSRKGHFSKRQGKLFLICHRDAEGIRGDLIFNYVVKPPEGKGKRAVRKDVLVAQNLRLEVSSSVSLVVDLSKAIFHWEYIAPETHPLLNSIERLEAENLQKITWFWIFEWLETVGAAYSRENVLLTHFYIAID